MFKKTVLKKCIILFIIFLLMFSAVAISVFADGEKGEKTEQSEDINEGDKEWFSFFKDILNVGFSSVAFILSLVSLHRSRSETVRVYYDKFEEERYKQARHVLYSYRNIKITNEVTKDDLIKAEQLTDYDFRKLIEACPLSDDEKKDNALFEKEKYPIRWIALMLKDRDNPEREKYNSENLTLKDYGAVKNSVSLIANFYQEWGILCRRGYLPMWVFDSSAGYNLIRLYLASYDFVEKSRAQNSFYARDFQWLCEKVYEIHTKGGLKGKRNNERVYRSPLAPVLRFSVNIGKAKEFKYGIDKSIENDTEFFGFETSKNARYVEEINSFAFRSLYKDKRENKAAKNSAANRKSKVKK